MLWYAQMSGVKGAKLKYTHWIFHSAALLAQLYWASARAVAAMMHAILPSKFLSIAQVSCTEPWPLLYLHYALSKAPTCLLVCWYVSGHTDREKSLGQIAQPDHGWL